MSSFPRTGRAVGALLLLQMAGFIVPFAMLHPITSHNWLADAAPAATQIHVAIGWLIANTLLTILISLLMWRVVSPRSIALTVLLLVISGLMLLFQCLDAMRVLAMLDLSRDVSSGNNGSVVSVAAELVNARRMVHYPVLVSIDAWMAMFYLVILRLRLLPMWLTIFALATVALHFGALVLPMLLGKSGIQPLGAAMALSHVIAGCWLLAKGFPAGDGQASS